MRVCSEPGCPEIQQASRCTKHARDYEKRRGTRHERGLGKEHDRVKKRMAPTAVGSLCVRCGELILPGQRWSPDHTDDRTGYRGPAHARCNLSAGGRAAHGLPALPPGG